MLDHGHPEARDYPVSMLWEESQLVVERINGLLATEATLIQAAATTAVAAFGKDGGKKAVKQFQKIIDRLTGNAGAPPVQPMKLPKRPKE